MSETTFKAFSAALCLSLIISGSAIAKPSQQDDQYTSQEIADPIEPLNRVIFIFNDFLDRVLIEPVAKGYNAVVPRVVRDSVQNFMRNLKSPLIVGNHLLQGEFGDAGVATARFVINSTVGVAGLADVAANQGLKYKNADFGKTLATWGAGNGFYLVLPILGPSSLRDASGSLVDSYADPVRLYAFNTHREWIYYTREAVEGLDNRSRMIRPIKDMRDNSLDYYAAARSAYIQHRNSFIHGDTADDKIGAASLSEDHP